MTVGDVHHRESDDERAARPWVGWAVAALAVASGLLTFASAQSLDFWGDEIFTLYSAQQEGVHQVLESMAAGRSPHPPLYNLLLHWWMAAAGESETTLRLPSVLFEMLSIVVVFRIGSLILDRFFGLLLAAITAFSPFVILFGSMARWYSLSLLLASLSVFYFLTISTEAGSKNLKNWILYALSTILLNYTHFITYSIIATQNVFYAYRHGGNRRAVRAWILCQAIVLVASFFSIQSLLTQAIGGTVGQAARFDLTNSALSSLIMLFYVPTSFSIGETLLPWNFLVTIPALPLFLFLVVKGGLGLHRARPEIAWLWLLYAALAFAVGSTAIGMVNLPISMISSHLIFIVPFYYSVLAMGIYVSESARARLLLSAGIAVVFGISIVNLFAQREFHNPNYRVPWKQIVSDMSSRVQMGDLIVSIEEVAFDYYLKQNLTDVKLIHYDLNCTSYVIYDGLTGEKESMKPQELEAVVARASYAYVWLVTRDRGAREVVRFGETVRESLERNYSRVDLMRYVEEDPLTMRFKSLLLGHEVSSHKVSVERYQRKSAEGAMLGGGAYSGASRTPILIDPEHVSRAVRNTDSDGRRAPC